jgi:hypothetical protein
MPPEMTPTVRPHHFVFSVTFVVLNCSVSTDPQNNRTMGLAVSASVSYLLDISLPSLPSWGTISSHTLPNTKLFSVTASEPGALLHTPPTLSGR